MKAKDLISESSTAIVLFTDGTHFHINHDRSGSTGHWKINTKRKYSQVIIYRRNPDSMNNDVYIADYAGIRPSPEKNRHVIDMLNIRRVGSTDLKWKEFSDGSQYPVRYIGKTI